MDNKVNTPDTREDLSAESVEPPTEPFIEMTKPSPESSKEEAPKVELKPLLEYLGSQETLPVIIASDLNLNQEEELLAILKKN